MDRVEFTKEMKEDYTILIPNMSPIHFELIKNVFGEYGYKTELLVNDGRPVVDAGLKYVHNDTCYPALLVIGQFIDAIESGKYDKNKLALMITQTGGGCRASNYIYLLRKALKKAGYGYIPVISLNVAGLEKNSGFKLSLALGRKMIAAIAYGDLMLLMGNQTMAYEVSKGDTDKVIAKWDKEINRLFKHKKGYSYRELKNTFELMAKDFADIKLNKTDKVKVGVVGEIYVKYAPLANNNLDAFLKSQDCEVMTPGILGFVLYTVHATVDDANFYGGQFIKKKIFSFLLKYLTKIDTAIYDAARKYKSFNVPTGYMHTRSLVDGVINHGTKMGEGWLLTAEMVELIESGYENIVCTQPFGCLPNHIAGKGMIRKLRELYPKSNIVPIDYDPGATKVNQENRIKLMIAVAKENKE